jgi:phenylacetate-coenzyme A ligase PaaK-like adenylate-forming protein
MVADYPREHWERVRAEAARMIAEVPLYQDRPPPPPADDPAAIAAWMAALPTVTKRDFRRGFPKNVVRAGFDLKSALEGGAVEIVSTSGTAGDRTQVLRDREWQRTQERVARSAGGYQLSTGTARSVTLVPPAKGSSCHSGNLPRGERESADHSSLTLNQLADPAHFTDGDIDRILDEWRDWGSAFAVANPSYLAPVARRATAVGRRLTSPMGLLLADELATRAQRRAIAAAVDAPLLDLYRGVDTGSIFASCRKGQMHVSRMAHVDLLPAGPGLARIVVTSLERDWNPLLRYDTGDLARIPDGPCACRQPGVAVARIEGRLVDSLEANGGLVTAPMVDDAIDREGLADWQLLLTPSGPELIALGPDPVRAAAAEAAASLLGRPVRLRPDAIVPEPSGKFRRVKKVES